MIDPAERTLATRGWRAVVAASCVCLLLAACAPATSATVQDGVVPDEALAPANGGPFDGDAATLDVLTFNAALLPVGDDEVRVRRAQAMPPYLAGYDVLVLQEAFAAEATAWLLDGVDEVYPYRTEVLASTGPDGWQPTSGGVVVASQWPIEEVREVRFGSVCSGTDCLADKGFQYVRLTVQGTVVHVVATHLQSAWGGDAAAGVRARQADAIRAFVVDLDLPAHEAVVIAGDLNVVQASDEAGPFFDRLRAVVPRRVGPLAYSWDPTLNPRAYGDREWLDYVTWSRDHLAPVDAWQRALVVRDGDDDLSDHYAVWARLTFNDPAAAAP